MEDLTLWVLQRVAKFPRDHKFTVGDRLTETCLDIAALLVEATFTHNKLDLLARASRGLTRARVLVRLCHRLGLLSADQRGYFATQTDELGRPQQQPRFALRQDHRYVPRDMYRESGDPEPRRPS